MNLRDLRYLLAVVEHGHFGRAAEASGVSQPTLSVQLRKLEAELGVVLLERGARGVAPTAACRRLLPHVRAAVAEADAIQAQARSLRDPLSGPFRLGIIPTLAPYLLPRVLAGLRARLPGLEIEPWEDLTDSLLERLREHDLDACLIATEPDQPDLLSRPLFDEPFLAALPPAHPLAARDTIAEEELARDILVLAEGHCLRDQALAVCRAATAQPMRATSLATLMHLVAAGYGTTLIPALAAESARDMGLVVRPLAPPASRTLRLVWRARSPRRPAVDALAEAIVALVARPSARPG
ncbi:LysR substrate-binding domain-containing protein [Elioraea thermophila]|uniref:LysR substrate-binding domain-containing protein n=1 Tax=Elioraea thermophila TaxID=2185104 RepID=UPI000DF44A1B|nr:LysR substrate-binding domain-containing protein [Elioraea thermophila]